MKNTKVIVSLIAASLVTMTSCKQDEKKDEKVILPLVELDTASIRNYKHKIIVQGNVTTDQDVILNSEAGGVITAIHVKEGEQVVRGQLLVSIDASVLNANLGELETRLDYAEYVLGKQEELRKRGVGSEFEYEQAKNQVNSIKANMKSLNAQRGKTSIRAPFSGTVDKIFAKDGQMTGPQASVLRLVNSSTVDITADISERHLANIQMGTPMEVSFPNFRDTTIHVNVTYVGNYIEPTNRTFRVMSTIKNNKVLLPNMLAEIRITDMNVDSALVIDSKSVLRNQDNTEFVYVANKKDTSGYTLKKVPVKVISKYDGNSYVTGRELKPGQLVVSAGGSNLAEGDVVRIK